MNGLYNIWVVILAGYLMGSFLNVVITRLPIMLGMVKKTHPFSSFHLALPASHCLHCHHPLKWWQNIPILSYTILKGRCYFCQKSIPIRYFIVEILTPILFCLSFWQASHLEPFIFYAFFCCLSLLILVIDWELMMIPDVLNYLLLWSGLLANSLFNFTPLNEAVWGAMLAYLGLWGFYHLIYWTTKKRGMGYGDFKLFAALGAWFGIFQIFHILFIASIIGLSMALIQYKKWGEPFPFGPALCLSGIFHLLMML